MKKINKKSTAEYLIVLCILFFFFGMSYIFFNLSLSIKNLDDQFQNNSETVKGNVVGYKFVSTGKSSGGDRPIIEYSTLDNQTYQHIAVEFGVVKESSKKK